ncbi:hypothetical protein HK405_006819 [Cladochytrium tenue]|nr:hypothetical protein HK405_006819 [Cladochytrium tenue]
MPHAMARSTSSKRTRAASSLSPSPFDSDVDEPTFLDSSSSSMAPPAIEEKALAAARMSAAILSGVVHGKRRPEDRELRRQARVVRNRMAAQVSRERKRQRLQELECVNASLVERLAKVEEENASLSSQISSLSSALEAMAARLAQARPSPRTLPLSPVEDSSTCVPSPSSSSPLPAADHANTADDWLSATPALSATSPDCARPFDFALFETANLPSPCTSTVSTLDDCSGFFAQCFDKSAHHPSDLCEPTVLAVAFSPSTASSVPAPRRTSESTPIRARTCSDTGALGLLHSNEMEIPDVRPYNGHAEIKEALSNDADVFTGVQPFGQRLFCKTDPTTDAAFVAAATSSWFQVAFGLAPAGGRPTSAAFPDPLPLCAVKQEPAEVEAAWPARSATSGDVAVTDPDAKPFLLLDDARMCVVDELFDLLPPRPLAGAEAGTGGLTTTEADEDAWVALAFGPPC